ncbi:hypothetical protein RCO27_10115 [Sphingosinicella sp. LHD-64]|uniref:hypothetical protein n=1 Tax=Sphingosinicella sp. LHD-64 TaxID=3072139 RepID=UPI0028102A2E|nr:hypothetical protein [Sphingosinicella sp. LHD-64]MDQ8756586.1 hypothetical protein [Sphingosinicella sp. LHD-64]
MSFARCFVGAALALAALPAAAQDFNAQPNFGTVNLRTGFTPDPQVIAVRSGGALDVQNLSSNCRGFISNAPDVRLNFEAGNLPLILSVNSSADTTLVVNGPDGQWYCDDDGGNEGLNPSLRFDKPSSGRYEIWIGTYGNSSYQEAQLHISELYSQ